MNAARNLNPDVWAVEDAMRPTYPRDRVERFVAVLRTFAAKPPHVAFDRPVAEHRCEVEALNRFLCELTFAAKAMLENVTPHSQLHRDIETLLQDAERSIRISRAALAALAGDPCAQNEHADILDEVRRIFQQRAQDTANRWSPAELELLSAEPRDPSPEIEDWLRA